MEALPRLPMLSFDLKHSPEYIEFGPTLKQYIKDHYGEDPALYNKACTDLEQLRQAAIQVTRDYMGCTTLKKYYTQLEYLLKRFPMGEGGEAAIAFTWEDVQTGRDHVISDIKFEQACILYNIGSLHSLLGVLDTRHNVEGMRVSCTHFQCAAWVFEYLRDNFSTSSMSTDMSYELLSFHIILMLAQSQECILEKSLIDNRKNNITAKVAAQVVEFYKDASRLIDLADQKQQISSRMHKEWGRRLLMKAAFYQSITYYFLGRRSQELEKHGECLAYYTAARDELARATQLAKNEVPEVLECLQFAKDVIMGKYESAKKDNDFVYHDKVPALESLPEVKGASLAKGIPVNLTDKEISGPDIFQKLVPMEAHEASSVYSEEKAKLSRLIVGETEQKNMELEQFMSSLQLDAEQLTPKPDLIPENLMEKCAAMSVRTNAIKELKDSMASVSGLTTEVELSIQELQQIIDEDAEKTEQFEKQYGKRNPSSVLPGLLEKLTGFRKRHEEGNQLNATLHKAMSTHTHNLKTLILAPSEIQAMLPPSQPVLSNEEQEVVSEIRRLLQKVNEMREQRKALLEQFRDKIQKDDITTVLVTQEKTEKESVFTEQLKKHDQIVGYIRQNLSSQDNILRHLTDVNAKYALIRQAYNEASARREKVVQELILSYEKYEELLAKSQKGVEYYKKLLQNVTETLERCRSECKVRQEERDMLTAKLAPKATPPSRPTAPKPELSNASLSSIPETSITGSAVPGEEFSSLPMPVQSVPSAQFQNLPPNFEGPKLKDYLPFMKPRSFGPKAAPSGATQDISIPPAVSSDALQFDSGNFNISQRYPGLDPNLVSVLPATIAQYLASVSSAGTSMAGGVRHSPSHSPSPQRTSTPPRHSPSPLATPPPSLAIMQGPQTAGYPQPMGPSTAMRHSNPVHMDAQRSQLPSSQAPQWSIPVTYNEQTQVHPGANMYTPTPSSTNAQQFAPSTTFTGGAVLPQQHLNYEQYGYILGSSHTDQYSNSSKHASTSTVSSANQPIFSPGQEAKDQLPFNFQQQSVIQTVPQQQQQYPQHPPQWTYILPWQQQQQHQPHGGQISFPSGQQYEMTGSLSSAQKPYESATLPVAGSSSQPPPEQVSTKQWLQNQFTSHGQNPLGHDQTSKSETPVWSNQTYSATSYGTQMTQHQMVSQHYQPPHPSSQGLAQPTAQTGLSQVYGPVVSNSDQHQQAGGYTGVMPQEMEAAGTKMGGSSQLIGIAGVHSSVGGNQQMGMNVGAISAQNEANQQGKVSNQTASPNQSPSRAIQLDQGQERIQVTSVGSLYARGKHQGPFVADYAYPNQQMYQNVGTTVYQSSQPYIGGYQHGIDRSYQHAQIFGTFTSKANVYGQSTQPISVQSDKVNTQYVMSHGSSLLFQNNQQPGLQIQSQTQGSKFQDLSQGPLSQTHGLLIHGQTLEPQIQGQTLVPQIQGQTLGPQIQGQTLGPQSQGQTQFPQSYTMGPQIQGQTGGLQIQGQMHGAQVQSQTGGPQIQGRMPGAQVQGQTVGPQVQGQMHGAQVQGQTGGPQIQGQMHGAQVQGQTVGPQIQGQMHGAQVQGQTPGSQVLTQVHGTQLQNQAHGLQIQGQGFQMQGQGFPTQGQGIQVQSHFQGQVPGNQGIKGQYPPQVTLPLVQPQQPSSHVTFQHSQQQLQNQGQQLPAQQFQSQPGCHQQPGGATSQQFQSQPGCHQQPGGATSQQFQSQPGCHQQPGGATSQQQSFQPQQQPMIQPQLQQLVGPYNPQLQMSIPGSSNQALHSGMSANITTMKPPLQPTNISGAVRPAVPGQVLSRPPTPGSQTSTNTTPTPTSPVGSEKVISRQGSSLDDILSSSPNGVSDTIITPQVLTDQERQLQKEEALKNQAIVPATEPYSGSGALHKFLVDVEAFGKFVDDLSVTILGVSRLDTVWKSLLDSQDAALKKQSMAIARCYPMKNRDPDIMPYDETRVVLATTKDDYINASWLNDLAPSCPKFITTQAPMPLTMGEFWTMVYEQGSEVLVQITSEYETGKKYPVYYPVEKDKALEQGTMLLSLQSVKFRQHWVERIIYLKNIQTKQGRTLVHLQYKNWPVSGFPDDISSIVRFISEVHSFYMQQRSLTKPVIVHCGFGIGRTGVFTLVYTAMQEILHGNGLVDVPGLARRMLQKRKGVLHKREQLKCCYDAVLCFAEEYLQKRGLLVKNPHFSIKISPKHQSHSQPASDDIVLGTVDLQTIRENVGRLRVHTDADKKEDISGSADQNLSKKSLESLSSISNSSLPDVVQQYGDTNNINELDKLGHERGNRTGSDASIKGLLNQEIFSLESQPPSGSQSLPCPMDLNVGQTSLPPALLSPVDSSKEVNPPDAAETVQFSLAQLQDPATFTLGSPDSKKKSKITKANFHQSKGSLQTTKGDPDDPLGSLDPMWPLTKK